MDRWWSEPRHIPKHTALYGMVLFITFYCISCQYPCNIVVCPMHWTISGKSIAPSHIFQSSLIWKREEVQQISILPGRYIEEIYLSNPIRALWLYLFSFPSYDGLKIGGVIPLPLMEHMSSQSKIPFKIRLSWVFFIIMEISGLFSKDLELLSFWRSILNCKIDMFWKIRKFFSFHFYSH